MSDRMPPDPVRRPTTPREIISSLPPVTTPDPSDLMTGLPEESGSTSASFARRASDTEAILPDFELISELGRGGMGVVYKARQKSLDRIVAIKMLLADPTQKPNTLSRFLAEAKAAASLNHPNIVGIYQIGECILGHFFAMEYVKGPTLQAVLEKQGLGTPLPITWTVNVLIPVAEAVHYAHKRGVIHRDLKPANILIDRQHRPVVMDFGIAKRVGDDAGLTQEGIIMGTPAYMPPEQAGEAVGEVGPHSDVYALGAILYRMLTGRLPYEAETALGTLLQVAAPDLPPPVRKLRPEVPLPLNLICMKCLNKRPEDRFPSAEALADELKAFRSAPGAASSSATHRRPFMPAVILIAEQMGKEVRLTQSASVIGRGSDCDMILKAADVSKRHCRILLHSDSAEVEDLDSVNGTTVNGKAITREVLEDGDLLAIAEHQFLVKLQLRAKK